MFENKKYHFLYLALTIIIVVIQLSCTHDSFLPGNMEPDPMDTMDIDTIPMDTTFVGNPCDTNVIYFQNDILPLLLGSCAFSGCHDAASASDGVILNNYDNVINTADVTPFNLSESKIYKVITENDPEDVMPPTGKLDNEKINLIAQWILQGAKNLECDH